MLFVPGGATNLTIDGGGSTLTFTKWTSAIRAARKASATKTCSSVRIPRSQEIAVFAQYNI
jgi:hypothetical protein